jgi:chemotaxis protein methyltransferase CheR
MSDDKAQFAHESENIELTLLAEAIYRKYGYDFRNYARPTFRRRVAHRMNAAGMANISEMTHALLHDPVFFDTLILDFSITVTDMFRDPSFYQALRNVVMPRLRLLPHIKIWHAGCATGEEVYSTAIMLLEEGVYDKTRIYATDYNEAVLRKAKEGIFPIGRVKTYTYNYQKAGGSESFSDYYRAGGQSIAIAKKLSENIVFFDHNLATDGVFSEMDVIMCRNVLIYFNRDLQNRAVNLFRDSLSDGGFLCLGSKETVRFLDCSPDFDDAVKEEKIYRKKPVMTDIVRAGGA